VSSSNRSRAFAIAFVAAALTVLVPPAARSEGPAPLHRYPTADEVFYVISCMDLNGHDADGLRRCSCAINSLERTLPYDHYADAEMVVAARQAGGRNAGIFRDSEPMKQVIEQFVRAQKAANAQCFSVQRVLEQRARERGGGGLRK
jgi:hypothetical protein